MVGGLIHLSKMSQFQFENFENLGGGLNFSEMSELNVTSVVIKNKENKLTFAKLSPNSSLAGRS